MRWVTIFTVTYPSEAHVIKMQLEQEGFAVFLKDELTIQTDNFISNAIGGVKIQVEQENVDAGIDLLKLLGYKKEKEVKEKSLLDKVYDFTAKIPILKNAIPEFRLMILVGVTLLCVLIPYFYSSPNLYNQLTGDEWCMDSLNYQGNFYYPKTDKGVRIGLQWVGDCIEKILFIENEVRFPGFETSEIKAKFKIEGSDLIIYESDTFEEIINGRYTVNISNGKLVMVSNKSSFISYKNNFQVGIPNINF